VQDLKKQIEEKDNEIGLLKEVLNSTKTMIKVKDKDLSRMVWEKWEDDKIGLKLRIK
jgi:hypothetical protein